MNFWLVPVSTLALSVVGGCSSTSPVASWSSTAADSSAPASGGADCANVVVTSYDTSCAQDSDCAAVPAGGNTCDPCHAGSGDFVCKLSGVNVKDSTRYADDLNAALQSIQGTSTYQQCVVASCPAGNLAPKCVANQCVVRGSDADAG